MRRVGVTSEASEDYKTFHALNAKVKNGAKSDDHEWGLEIDIFILMTSNIIRCFQMLNWSFFTILVSYFRGCRS